MTFYGQVELQSYHCKLPRWEHLAELFHSVLYQTYGAASKKVLAKNVQPLAIH